MFDILLLLTNLLIFGMWIFDYKISTTPKEKKIALIWIVLEGILIVPSIINIFI